MYEVANVEGSIRAVGVTQWFGTDSKGREVYIRYRNWTLELSIDGDEKAALELNQKNPEHISDEKMVEKLSTSPKVSFSDDALHSSPHN